MVNILYQSREAYTKAAHYLCRHTFTQLKLLLSEYPLTPKYKASQPPAHVFKSNCHNTLTTLHSPWVTTSPYRKPLTPYRSTKRPPAPKCKGLWSGSLKYHTNQLPNFDWYNTYIPEKILGTFFGNVDCTHLNIDWQLQSLRNTITTWKPHELALKAKLF